eukprot:gene3409-3871_t
MKNPASEVGRATMLVQPPGATKIVFVLQKYKLAPSRLPAIPTRIEVWGDHLLSPQERKKGELSRERGINGHCGQDKSVYAAKVPLLLFLLRLSLLQHMINLTYSRNYPKNEITSLSLPANPENLKKVAEEWDKSRY